MHTSLDLAKKRQKGFHIPVYEGENNVVLIWGLTFRIGALGAQSGNFGPTGCLGNLDISNPGNASVLIDHKGCE